MSQLSPRPRARSSQGARRAFDGMSKGNVCAAGVDIGAPELMACVPEGDDQHSGRACGPSPADRASLADWGIDRGIQTGAMDATGVYGLPLCETLAARGL